MADVFSNNDNVEMSSLVTTPFVAMDLTPLHLLDQLLHSTMTEMNNNTTTVTDDANDYNKINNNECEEDNTTLERILKGVEFLYGNDSVSLVEGALSILDSHNRHPTVTSRRMAPVRLVRAATSGRQVMVVQGGSSTTNSNNNANHKEYACQLGMSYLHFSKSDGHETKNKALGRIGFHCTCRSFHERSKKNIGSSFEICKHLLAVRLAPIIQQLHQQKSQHFNYYYAEENVSDKEYAQMMIRLYS